MLDFEGRQRRKEEIEEEIREGRGKPWLQVSAFNIIAC